jgi:hypothetical protein
MYSFLIVAFSGIDLALLAQASCLDLILFRNLVTLSVVLLAFASKFCNELFLFPKRGLFQLSDDVWPFSPWNDGIPITFTSQALSSCSKT